MRHTTRLACTFLLGLIVPAGVWGRTLPERFTLGDYIPGDVWLYMHGVHNPETDWLNAEWDEVFSALKASGLEKDVISFAFSFVPEEKKAEYRGEVDKWMNLLKSVRWEDMFAEEHAFAERMLSTAQGPKNIMGVDYILLTRGKEGSGEANFTALAAILKEISLLSDKLKLVDDERDGIKRLTLYVGLTAEAGKEVTVSLFRRGDVVGITNSKSTSDEVLDLMTGASEKSPVSKSKRLKEALAQVPAPEDMVMFFDARTMFGSISDLLTRAVHVAGQPSEEDKKALDLITKVFSRTDAFDYIVSAAETQGHQQLTHSVSRIQEGKQTSDLAKLIVNRKPFTRFDEYVPIEASNFSAEAFVDLEGAYNAVIDFIKQEVNGGAGMIEQWNGLLAGIGFDPQKDLFSWWSGEMLSIEMPAAVVTPIGGTDSVFMIRVKDGELASQKINGWLELLQSFLKEQGQPLMITPAQVGVEGFKQVTYPPMMMFLNPVIGVKGEWLMIASSAGGLTKCLETAAGKHPSVAENERFKREGLVPKRPALSCSFTDTSRFGDELAGAVGMAGFIGGLVTAPMPDNPEAAKAKKAIQSIMQIVMKLGPVFQKLDFYSSEASMSFYDGELSVRSEKVVTYKEPSGEKVKTAAGQQ